MMREIVQDLARWSRLMPRKGQFLLLLGTWLALFQFLGNSTLGYLKSSSLFSWMYYVFTTSPDDDFCLYIPLVVLGLLIWKRRELMETPTRFWWPGLWLVAGALVLHLAGYAVQQARVSIIAMMVGLYGLTGLMWGPLWLRNSFFPMFLLLFCVPIASVSDGLTLPLRLLATWMAVGFSHTVLGIAVFQNGVQMLGPQGIPLYEVAPACSGIRSLMSMLVLMLIYSFIFLSGWWRRLLIIVSAAPVAILGNALRLIVVIVVGEAFGVDAGVAIEQNLGFLTFALGLGCMFLLGHWLRESHPAPVPSPTPAAAS
jgi:exosortase